MPVDRHFCITFLDNDKIWLSTANMAWLAKLENGLEYDACIIGAGITRLAVAYMLRNEGLEFIAADDVSMAPTPKCYCSSFRE